MQFEIRNIMKVKKWLIILAGALIGGWLGYLYWTYTGFEEKTPLISSLTLSMLYSSSLGGLLMRILTSSEQIEV